MRMCPACPGPLCSIFPPCCHLLIHTPYFLKSISRVSLRRKLLHQFSLMTTEGPAVHKASHAYPNLSLPFISGFSLIINIDQVTGGNSFPKRQSREELAEEKGTGPVMPPTQSPGVLSIPTTVGGGSYFMIWSGTGLFLNLGCSSRTGWTVKHWMSMPSKLRI